MTVETMVTTHDGKKIHYAQTHIMGEAERANRERIVHYKQRAIAEDMLNNNHFFGSTIGPLRITEAPWEL